MQLYGSHFEYRGVNSRKYNLIIANVETERYVHKTEGISGNTIYNKKNKKRYYVSDDYSDAPLTFEVEFVTPDGCPLNQTERHEIERWLFNRSGYGKLYTKIDDPWEDFESIELVDGEQKRLYLNCRFMNPEKLEYYSGVVGYRATMETDSAFAWQDKITKSFAVSGESATFTIHVDSDLDDYIYPRVEIRSTNGGTVKIANHTDDNLRFTVFENLSSGATVVTDGSTCFITDGLFENFTSRKFVRLRDGDNNIVVTGEPGVSVNAVITFEWNNRRAI